MVCYYPVSSRCKQIHGSENRQRMDCPALPDFISPRHDALLFTTVMLRYIQIPQLRGPVPLSHLFITPLSCGRETDAVDATCGNGHDTLLLGRTGGDQRPGAGPSTSRSRPSSQPPARLAEGRPVGTVELIHGGHETMAGHAGGPVWEWWCSTSATCRAAIDDYYPAGIDPGRP